MGNLFRTRDEQVLQLKAELQKARKIIAVQQAEIDAMAGVIVRDRQRVAAECAQYSRQRAEAEGIHERDPESNGRFGSVLHRG